MLVLTRKSHEQILIGQNIVVSIVDIQRNKVRVSIDAPHHVKILRGELTRERNGKNSVPRPRHLLIADSSATRRAALREYLGCRAEARFEIAEAENGAQALALCKQQPPDCVLLNYHLPDLDGLAFLDQLHHDGQGHRVPVIMIADDSNARLAVLAMKFGAVDYLPHGDLSCDRLHQALQEVLG